MTGMELGTNGTSHKKRSDNTWDDDDDDDDKKDNMNTTIINKPHCTLGILLSAWQWKPHLTLKKVL